MVIVPILRADHGDFPGSAHPHFDFISGNEEGDMQMIKYIIRRILMLIPVILGVIVVVFTINYFNTSSPAITILGASATPETIAQVEAELGLDRP